MADITYADRDPQDTDSPLDIRLKRMLTIQQCTVQAGGTPNASYTPQDTDSITDLDRKELQLTRELEVALGG